MATQPLYQQKTDVALNFILAATLKRLKISTELESTLQLPQLKQSILLRYLLLVRYD